MKIYILISRNQYDECTIHMVSTNVDDCKNYDINKLIMEEKRVYIDIWENGIQLDSIYPNQRTCYTW